MTLAHDIAGYIADWHNRPSCDGFTKPEVIAAGLERENIIIPKADLPEVKDARDGYVSGGQSVVFTSEENALYWVLRDVAVWQHIKARESEATRLQERRDEAADFYVGVGYDDLSHKDRVLIERLVEANDRIIELERAAS